MVTLPISETLARKLEAIAQQHQQSLEEMLSSVAEQYQTDLASENDAETTPPKPAFTRIEDDSRYQQAKREVSRRVYARARDYWAEAGNDLRAALTDEELHEQFWRFDEAGVPLLKEDQATRPFPPRQLLQRLDEEYRHLFAEGKEHLIASEHNDTRHILQEELPRDLLRHMGELDED